MRKGAEEFNEGQGRSREKEGAESRQVVDKVMMLIGEEKEDHANFVQRNHRKKKSKGERKVQRRIGLDRQSAVGKETRGNARNVSSLRRGGKHPGHCAFADQVDEWA